MPIGRCRAVVFASMLVVAFLAASACTSFGVSSSSSSGSSASSSSSSSSGSVLDAGDSGGSAFEDGSSSSNGGLPDGTAAAKSPCPPNFPFCDDFERDDVEAANGWVQSGGFATIGIDVAGAGDAPSPTRVLRLTSTNNQDTSSYIKRAIQSGGGAAATRRVRVSFAMSYQAGDKIRQIASLEIDPTNTGHRRFLIIHTFNKELYLVEQDLDEPSTIASPTGITAEAGWFRYDADFDLGNKKMTLSRNGTGATTVNIAFDVSDAVTNVRFGFTYAEPGGVKGSVRFDDMGILESAN